MTHTSDFKQVGGFVADVVADTKSNTDKNCCVLSFGPQPSNLPPDDRDRALICQKLRDVILQLVTGKLPWPLLLHGEAGSGKTCAALCMIDYYGGKYFDFPSFHANLRLAMAGELFSDNHHGVGGFRIYETDIWNGWAKSNLTVIDDFCTREPTSFQYETLKQAIDKRHRKPAVFTANLTLEEISRIYDDRIASRLSAGTIVKLEGDRRLSRVNE